MNERAIRFARWLALACALASVNEPAWAKEPKQRSTARAKAKQPKRTAKARASAPPGHAAKRKKKSKPSDAERAERIAQEARRHEKARAYEKARTAYQRAFDLDGRAAYELGLARVEEALNAVSRAALWYQRVLENDDASAADRRTARRALTRIAKTSGKLQLHVPEDFEGTVSLDDRPLEPGALEDALFVKPGMHSVHAENGTGIFDELVFVKRGEVAEVTIALKETRAGIAAAPDGDDSPGSEGDGTTEASTYGSADSKQLTTAQTVGVMSVFAGAVGIGVGAYMGIRSIETRGTLERNCDSSACTPKEQTEFDRFQQQRNTAIGGFVVGGVGLAAGTALLLLGGAERPPAESRTVVPLVGIGHVGVKGRF